MPDYIACRKRADEATYTVRDLLKGRISSYNQNAWSASHYDDAIIWARKSTRLQNILKKDINLDEIIKFKDFEKFIEQHAPTPATLQATR